ncbi:hypothetical protein D3C80_1428410 [compost metagenome]
MPVTAEITAHIARQSTNIGTLAAFHFEMCMVTIGHSKKAQPVNLDFTCRDFNGFALTGQIVSAFTSNLDGGELWWNLHDGAGIFRQKITDRLFFRPGLGAADHFAFKVVCCAFFAPRHREFINFPAIHHVWHSLCGITQCDGQHA